MTNQSGLFLYAMPLALVACAFAAFVLQGWYLGYRKRKRVAAKQSHGGGNSRSNNVKLIMPSFYNLAGSVAVFTALVFAAISVNSVQVSSDLSSNLIRLPDGAIKSWPLPFSQAYGSHAEPLMVPESIKAYQDLLSSYYAEKAKNAILSEKLSQVNALAENANSLKLQQN